MNRQVSPFRSQPPLALGRKGRDTRQRLMAAATRLLQETSPMDLTAMAIAAEAGTASATFYVYFRDVQDILYALSEAATEDMLSAFAALDIFRSNATVAEDSDVFLAMLADQWERHSAVLHYRMMEADRGDPRFTRLRGRWAEAVLSRFWELLKRAPHLAPPLDELDAYAESIVLFASIERLAAAIQREPKLSISPQRMRAAQARVLTRMIASAP
ncbi:MAG: TetR/AcrR family transcriptional regulator [Alphaproteobacteria bacterium HGW-Alphaproteobacteria-16]|nr:MAG: TetR/AcrR family transcriptional regulator [Alphaproteobacteria bacterium HGW-Alphaproteobacteria-16]